jgi:hypothetical protein
VVPAKLTEFLSKTQTDGTWTALIAGAVTKCDNAIKSKIPLHTVTLSNLTMVYLQVLTFLSSTHVTASHCSCCSASRVFSML